MNTKQERLQHVINQLAEKVDVPLMLRPMVSGLMDQSMTFCQQLSNEEIDEMMNKFSQQLDYVKNGHLPFEDCMCEMCDDHGTNCE